MTAVVGDPGARGQYELISRQGAASVSAKPGILFLENRVCWIDRRRLRLLGRRHLVDAVGLCRADHHPGGGAPARTETATPTQRAIIARGFIALSERGGEDIAA